MAGTDFVFNISKGAVAELAKLPGANDALVLVVLEAAGLEADGTLRDYDDLASLLAGSSNEQTTLGRKTVSASVTVTISDVNDWVDVDMPDPVWTGSAGNPTGKLLVCLDTDTTSGTDANVRPLTAHSFDVTPDGTDVTGNVASSGFYRAA